MSCGLDDDVYARCGALAPSLVDLEACGFARERQASRVVLCLIYAYLTLPPRVSALLQACRAAVPLKPDLFGPRAAPGPLGSAAGEWTGRQGRKNRGPCSPVACRAGNSESCSGPTERWRQNRPGDADVEQCARVWGQSRPGPARTRASRSSAGPRLPSDDQDRQL